MKTSIYTILLGTLALSGLKTFAADATSTIEKNLKVPVPQLVLGLPEAEVPQVLANIKAKNALVPLAPFTKGEPEFTADVKLLAIPVPQRILGDSNEQLPENLNVKVKSLNVPLAPRVLGDQFSDTPVL